MTKKKGKAKYDPAVYTGTRLQHLVLFSIYLVTARGETCTFERLVAECFSHFPEVFAFKGHPEWPDSLKFDGPLSLLRKKGQIIGGLRDHFSLTEFGEQVALETQQLLEKPGRRGKELRKLPTAKRADDTLIEQLKASVPFGDFLRDRRRLSISETEFRNMLRCTLETPLRVVKQNLYYYKKLAESFGEKDVTKFLLLCERRFIQGEKNG